MGYMVRVSYLLGDLCTKKMTLGQRMCKTFVGSVHCRRGQRGPTIHSTLQQEARSCLWIKSLQFSLSSVSLTASRALQPCPRTKIRQCSVGVMVMDFTLM